MTRAARGRRRCLTTAAGLGVVGLIGLPGCVTIGVGNEVTAHRYMRLLDGSPAPERLPQPWLAALLLQPVPGDAMADTQSMVYARSPGAYSFYRQASWTERPDRRVPQLLKQRLEQRGVAAAVGLLGDPMRADWLLSVAVNRLFHDASQEPGSGQAELTLELFDRRSRVRVARGRFAAQAPAARADSEAAAAAMSAALGQVFDVALPWLEGQLALLQPAPPANR
jgi:ABC-type uncharacterized transport system auxiliary subunit